MALVIGYMPVTFAGQSHTCETKIPCVVLRFEHNNRSIVMRRHNRIVALARGYAPGRSMD